MAPSCSGDSSERVHSMLPNLGNMDVLILILSPQLNRSIEEEPSCQRTPSSSRGINPSTSSSVASLAGEATQAAKSLRSSRPNSSLAFARARERALARASNSSIFFLLPTFVGDWLAIKFRVSFAYSFAILTANQSPTVSFLSF